MEPFRPLSTSDQLADYLRRQIRQGVLTGSLPGVHHLVKSLGVNSMAVDRAVKQLEREGLVINRGPCKSRLIASDALAKPGSLHVGMLIYDESDGRRLDVLAIKQELMSLGHSVTTCSKNMVEMGLNVERIARHAQAMKVDAWVVCAGSREILQWFESQELPAFALHGRLMEVNLPSASVRKTPVISELVDKLAGWGHRRIVMVTREERRKPQLGFVERSFISDLERNGIETGPYNIPDWEDSPEGMQKLIASLFRVTPPTAMIIGDSTLFHAAQINLASMGIFAPRDVSLFCLDFQDSFAWARPAVSHIQWDHLPAVRRIAKWISNVSKGRQDVQKRYIKARMVEGETIGPAKKAS